MGGSYERDARTELADQTSITTSEHALTSSVVVLGLGPWPWRVLENKF